MPANRFFLKELLIKGQENELFGEEFLHLTQVMRKGQGHKIELINGENILATGIITHLSKKSAKIAIDSVKTVEVALPPITLVQALLKPKSLELIVQKATELGVSEFLFFPAEGSEKKELSDNLLRRLNQILIGALKQSGRCDLPKITLCENLFSCSFERGSAFFGDLEKGTHLKKAIKTSLSTPLFFIIGPEKGFSKKEKTFLKAHAKGVLLSPYILRAESAAIAAIALLSSHYWG